MGLDIILPPRCTACGEIVAEVGLFCGDCWTQIEFLPRRGCDVCGLPLEATGIEICAVCLAHPPRLDRIRAAVAYGEISRSLAIRLKYGRKVAIARTMVRYMEPLIEADSDAVLVPVPLHRRRLWSRGFNQSGLLATTLAASTGQRVDARMLRRTRPTRPLKGLSLLQRRRTVAGAFAVPRREEVEGRTIILVDDVYTTGSTANACARALKRAGARRVELISWARVVRPAQLMR